MFSENVTWIDIARSLLSSLMVYSIPIIILCVSLITCLFFWRKINKDSRFFDIVELLWIICTVITVFFTVTEIQYSQDSSTALSLHRSINNDRAKVREDAEDFGKRYCERWGDGPDYQVLVDKIKYYCDFASTAENEARSMQADISFMLYAKPLPIFSGARSNMWLTSASNSVENVVGQTYMRLSSLMHQVNNDIAYMNNLKPRLAFPALMSALKAFWFYIYAVIIGLRLVKPALQLFGAFQSAKRFTPIKRSHRARDEEVTGTPQPEALPWFLTPRDGSV